MLTIRLHRVGRKNDPSFRVILVESKRAAKTGNFNEILGSYDPRSNRVELKADRIKHWLGMGVVVSDTVHNLLVSQNILEGKKKNVLPRKSPIAKEAAEGETSSEEGAAPSEGAEASTEEPAPAESALEEAPAEEKSQEGDNAVAEEKASA